MKHLPSLERLNYLFVYCPDDGIIRWKNPTSNRIKAGSIAGKTGPRQYLTIGVDKERFLVHRIVFKMMTGHDPQESVDHINGDTSDNRWLNLRDCTQQQNTYNARIRKDNITGCKNVYRTHSGTFQVKLNFDRKLKCIGTFDNLELASLVAEEARNKYHGTFSNNGV